jgi:hypothetical protein
MHPPATNGTTIPASPPRGTSLLLRAPLLLCAAVLLAPLLLSVLLVALRVADPASRLRLPLEQLQTPALGGMHTPAPTPRWSVSAIAAGRWQQQFDAWWNTRLPLRGLFVRSTNQAYYSLFSKSYALERKVMIGREHHLFHQEHVEIYCDWPRLRPDPQRWRAWALGIREIQDFYARRGQAFVYVIAPNKPPAQLDYLPAGLACPAPLQSHHAMLVPALAQAGVIHVDGARIAREAPHTHPAELLFPAGSYHWSELMAAIVVRDAIQAAGRQGLRQGPHGKELALPEFRYRVHRNPAGLEAELADILNLWSPHKDYPVPQVFFPPASPTGPTGPTAPAASRPLRLAMVGDSFLNNAAEILARSGVFSSIDHFYYFSLEHRQYVDGRMTKPANTGIAPADYAALLAAEVVVVEENSLDLGGRDIQLLREHLGMAALASAK